MNLYYRLNVLRLKLPPLREHPEDILLEVETFVSQWCSDELLASRVNEILQKHEGLLAAHTWPGNVRELQNVVKRVIALVETMTGNSVEQEIEDLLIETFGNSVGSVPRTKPTKYTSSLKAALADVERELIRQQSEESHCSMADLAKKLGIGRTTLWRKLNHPELR